jgi:hypothetical protein
MRRLDLVTDCARCSALCCVATSFDASEDFAFDKAAGERCRHLRSDDRCAIPDALVARGCTGCAIYECHGAGPRITRIAEAAGFTEPERNEAFLRMREVHELLWLLTEAQKRCPASHSELAAQLGGAIAALDAIAREPPHALLDLDLRADRRAAHTLLRDVGRALGGRR